MKLDDSIATLKGVGVKKEKSFNSSGIFTINDLIHFFPVKYEDRRSIQKISDLKAGEKSQIYAKLLFKKIYGYSRKGKSTLELKVRDSSGEIKIYFFNASFLTKSLEIGESYLFFGKISEGKDKNLSMIHPDFTPENEAKYKLKICPTYRKINSISTAEIVKLLKVILEEVNIPEPLPEKLLTRYSLIGYTDFIKNMHFPQNVNLYKFSRYRLIFEELLILNIYLSKLSDKKNIHDSSASINTSFSDAFIKKLRFELTEEQKKSWSEISKDLESDKPMNRLLQGDVGSGKTVIAELAIYSAYHSGYQAVLMAPTEILARQHYASFMRDYSDIEKNDIAILLGSTKDSEKQRIKSDIKKGKIKILVATHTVLEDNVEFLDLRLCVTDEQHRFGVKQRKRLQKKASAINVLTMSATPIPRTLANILYGDGDISQIRELPNGRRPVKTFVLNKKTRKKAYKFLSEEMKQGGKAFIVCPRIEHDEKTELNSVTKVYKEVSEKLPEYKVCVLHGLMKPEEKERIAEKFHDGDIDILVSTVVIEVGIDVPDANMMIIENAERFGLAQLHQLRGRVGRGQKQSYCFMINESESEISKKRCEIMAGTNDGFEIADKDLELRGPGEIFGIRQHGIPDKYIFDYIKYKNIRNESMECANEILEEDFDLNLDKYSIIKKELDKFIEKSEMRDA